MQEQPIAAFLAFQVGASHVERMTFLFDTHYERLYRLARRLTANPDDALDLVQETFLRAARSLNSIPDGILSEQESWLVQILINIRRDQWRKARVRVRHGQEQGYGNIRSIPSPEAAIVASATLWRALDQLSSRRRAIVVMHELDAISVPAIAKLLGISTMTVRWHLSSGRRELARVLTRLKGKSDEIN